MGRAKSNERLDSDRDGLRRRQAPTLSYKSQSKSKQTQLRKRAIKKRK